MPHFDHASTIEKMLKATAIVLICATGMVWLNQRSLNEYWAVHFHRESPWQSFAFPLWTQGALIMSAAESAKETFIKHHSADIVEPLNSFLGDENPVSTVRSAGTACVECSGDITFEWSPQNEQQLTKWIIGRCTDTKQPYGDGEVSSISPSLYDAQGNAVLAVGKKVLMIGDSMMEGVAPRVLSQLQKEHGIDGINLSRRSTGLAYPGYFNWPETTKRTLESDPDIGLLVVFLGPNDPWNMPGGPSKPYLKFKSQDWETEYRSRIRNILSLAQQHTVPIIWLLPPNMRPDKLNQSMAWLDTLYHSEVKAVGGITLSVNALFGYKDEIYSPTAMIDDKTVSLRAPDGIHFSPTGQKLIAQAIIKNITFEQTWTDHVHEE